MEGVPMEGNNRKLLAIAVVAALLGGIGVPAIGKQYNSARSELIKRAIEEETAKYSPNAASWGLKEWRSKATECEMRLEDASHRLATIAVAIDLRDL